MNKINLKYTKSTKNTHVYANEEQDAIIPTIYIKKHGLPNTPPQEIIITIDYEQ